MVNERRLPDWPLDGVALIVIPSSNINVTPFLESNPAAVHPTLTAQGSWESGLNQNPGDINSVCSSPSEIETEEIGAPAAALLLRKLPINGGAYFFGRDTKSKSNDVILPGKLSSRQQFCVYPRIKDRTWIIQDVSGKGTTFVDNCQLSSKAEDQVAVWRALRYDTLNKVTFPGPVSEPGVTIYLQPVWPNLGSGYRLWDWIDPGAPMLAGLNLNSMATSTTVKKSQGPHRGDSNVPVYYVLPRQVFDNPNVLYAQNLVTGVLLVAERFLSESQARESFKWRKEIEVGSYILD